MAKKVDITEKLELDENPCLVIRKEEIEVNADAATVLKIMGLSTDEDHSAASLTKKTLEMYALIFPEKSQKQIEKMKMSAGDLNTVIEAAMELIRGGDKLSKGENQTHTTT